MFFRTSGVATCLSVLCACFALAQSISSQQLKINEKEYFETPGVNVFVFNNQYNGMFFDEKTAGIELIHHGVRTATGGAVRLQNTPEQWDLVPTVLNRKVDRAAQSVSVDLYYQRYDFRAKVTVFAKDKGLEINVWLDKPVPASLVGSAGFNLEFLPSAYFEKNYCMDGQFGFFPRYPSGNTVVQPNAKKIPQFAEHSTFDDRGRSEFIVPLPLASGKSVVLSPEDPENRVKISSSDADLMLLDGRNLAQNGWFVVRSLLPARQTGKVLSWYLEANAIPNWIRKPVVQFSQVGYTPEQQKIAVIELDVHDKPLRTASVYSISPDGQATCRYTGEVKAWGPYMRYNYAKFDFSEIKQPGIYYLQYGNQKTNTFAVNANVYDAVWHPTMDVWFPVQMDHMQVNEAYRVWHGEPYRDDCLQAPLHLQHFDGYSMGDTTDTKYKPLERIPGMAVGGWFDAGDFDIQTGSHNDVVSQLAETWECFKPERDETFVDQQTRYVDIRRPDGKPDILQQIAHGTLNLVAQCENIGHPVRGIVVPKLHQYHHLGDAINETDNLPYNPLLKPYETDGKSSGTMDDRWAFTTRTTFLDYQTAAALAAASRVLHGFDNNLSERSLHEAIRLVDEADEIVKTRKDTSALMRMWEQGADIDAILQLYITTKDKRYSERFQQKIFELLAQPAIGAEFGQMFFAGRSLTPALKAIPYMDETYKTKLRDFVLKYKQMLEQIDRSNPYGLPIAGGGWGGTGTVVNFAITNYYAYKVFPDIMTKEDVLKGLNYVFGCHPYSNISFVNAVGTRSKRVAYGNNRADFTTIAGGIVPGIMLLKPDFPENKDDWPFFWGENEVTIGGCAEYVFLANAVHELLK